MTLVFNENEYAIERFSYTIVKEKGLNHEKRINCVLDNLVNVESLIDKLENDFDGDIVINTLNNQFTFTGYEFESLDMNGDSTDTFIAINFSK